MEATIEKNEAVEAIEAVEKELKKISTWKGSPWTAGNVMAQIESRWGAEEVKNYDPLKNCFTFNSWRNMGYKVKKGEKALRSITFVKKELGHDEATGEKLYRSFPKSVCLFYYLQVEKM